MHTYTLQASHSVMTSDTKANALQYPIEAITPAVTILSTPHLQLHEGGIPNLQQSYAPSKESSPNIGPTSVPINAYPMKQIGVHEDSPVKPTGTGNPGPMMSLADGSVYNQHPVKPTGTGNPGPMMSLADGSVYNQNPVKAKPAETGTGYDGPVMTLANGSTFVAANTNAAPNVQEMKNSQVSCCVCRFPTWIYIHMIYRDVHVLIFFLYGFTSRKHNTHTRGDAYVRNGASLWCAGTWMCVLCCDDVCIDGDTHTRVCIFKTRICLVCWYMDVWFVL